MLEAERGCQDCHKPFGKMAPITKKYCGSTCRQRAYQGRARDKKLLELAESQPEPRTDRTMGGTRRKLIDTGLMDQIMEGSTTATAAAAMIGVTVASVSRAAGQHREEIQRTADELLWKMTDAYASMLPVEAIEELRDFHHTSTDLRKEQLEILVCEAFWRFEHEFVTIGSKQISFIRKPFHSEIIEGMVKSFVWAKKTLILTPPRHGKSELMIRFVAWLILMFPNIQILWVAANTDLATQMTGKLKGIFEYNKELREAFLPPGKRFGDKGCRKWTEDAFTLYTRTDHTLKSPTFTGLGSTSTVAGRDCDFIGIDDLEERKTVATADLREKSRRKHAEIMERQEDHTGVITIGSRQHPDDIPNHLLAQDGSSAWDVLVYPAHDEIACEEDDDDWDDVWEVAVEDRTKHLDCMLMPEIRSYAWLMEQADGADALGFPGLYPLRYLQKAVPVEGIIFDIPLIREKCLDRSRGLGMRELPAMKLVAGLDPAARGVQASFAWGWDGTTLYMIDLEEHKAGGVLGAVDVMERWYEHYDMKVWFHEDNSGQIDAWEEVPEFRDVIDRLQLDIQTHTTGKNKHDPESGISSMAAWYHAGRINLPYGTPTARKKVKALLRQLELWTSDGLKKKGKTDIKMAHWFPFPRIQKWYRSDEGEVELELTSNQSYPAISTINESPWGHTPYPGG